MWIRLFAALYLLAVGVPVFADQKSNWLQLEWSDLVPENWSPPLIAPDPSKHQGVDPASLQLSLDNKLVVIPGFFQATKVGSDNTLHELVLVPFLEHHVARHFHHQANQTIYVKLAQPLKVDSPFQPIWVRGRLKLSQSMAFTTPPQSSLLSKQSAQDAAATQRAHAGYLLLEAEAKPYIY